jgi:iron complex transport system substrate-binding protein
MRVNVNDIVARPDWPAISAVRNRHVYEIQSSLILQPGPAALTEGVRQIHAILARVAGVTLPPALRLSQNLNPPLL